MDLNILNGWVLALATAAAAVVWWVFRSQHAKVSDLDRELSAFKLHCAETYVTTNSMQKTFDTLSDAIKAVFSKLERIEDKLDGKADKQ